MERLFEPERHEPLAAAGWDAKLAGDAIERIVTDTRAGATADGVWPVHPSDGPEGMAPFGGLYFGPTGVIWALDYLASAGAVQPGPSLAGRLGEILRSNREVLARFGSSTPGYLMADVGILLLQHKLTGSAQIADELAILIEQNLDDPARELMWGAPGTMLAARFMHGLTGEERWAALFRAGAEALRRDYALDESAGCEMWTQHLYGQKSAYLGAVHGFSGNAFVLDTGRELLPPEAWTEWRASLVNTLAATAWRDGHGVNWPVKAHVGAPLLVQHCHGAPGMITCLAGIEGDIDELLLAAGELTWTAGPLIKGANLCHGTAGNGYAFLKLFERTRDSIWLERARAFAMHAVAQSDAEAAALGRRRYSLWTGDLGLAVYLLDCLEERARFPTLDVF